MGEMDAIQAFPFYSLAVGLLPMEPGQHFGRMNSVIPGQSRCIRTFSLTPQPHNERFYYNSTAAGSSSEFIQYGIAFYLHNTVQFKRLFGIFAICTYIVP